MSDNKKYYDYLDELRESGETNMWGASAYLMAEFDISRTLARAILTAWMAKCRGLHETV